MANQGYGHSTSFEELMRQLVKSFNRKRKNDYFYDLNSLR